MQIQGIYCAVWIPANAEGEVLWHGLDQQLQFLAANNVDGVMVLGTTGNFPFFDLGLRKKILEHIARWTRDHGTDIPLMVNISDISFRNVLHLGAHAKDHGAAAMAVLPPWYYPATGEDVAEFLIAAGRQVDLPLALYNYPEVTGKTIDVPTLRRVAQAVPVRAFKQSGGAFEDHSGLLPVARELSIPVLTGWDTRLPEARQMGVKGAISGLANAVPDVLTRLWRKLAGGEETPPESAFMAELAREISILPFPYNIRACMAARGLNTGELINPASAETLGKYEGLVSRLKDLFRQHDLPPANRD